MDTELIESFKQIINRISDNVIDEMAENKVDLNSANFMIKMEMKLKKYSELFSEKS